MSTLTGNKISLTYKSLIKTADNDVLTGALKELSDGLGNNSGVFLNTGGDLKSTGTLEFSNFKATAYAVTINKLVNEADGISNNDNDTSLPTSAAVKDYVDTHVTTQDLDFVGDNGTPGAVDLDSQSFNVLGTTNEIVTSSTGFTLTIGLPDDVTISGTYTGATFSGDLSGTINTATTATTQTAGDNSTKVATTAYVDTLDAASDLDFSDGTNNSAVNLNTQVLSIEGTSNEITTSASGQSLTVSLDSAGVDLPDNSTAITQTAGDNSTKVATTAYVDVLDAASDLDIAGDTGTGDVNLNTQTLTLQGTTNQVTTAVSGQTTTFSLPSTVHRNLQGNVTGDLTGNADTATAWQTARDLSLTNEATGTISSVDGTGNVSGSVTLLNSAVTAKVLTGLPTPSAGNIQASDTILQAFGKLQSQVSSISNGLIFKGSWDADTNTPTLTSGGGEVDQGTTTGQAANKLIDTSQNFNVTVSIGDKVINQVDGQSALVTVIDSNTQLSLDADIMLSSEAYTIDASPFIQQGQYYVVNYAGTTNLNGITDWSIGDWVIADADNRWSKLDHSQVDGQGSIGNLPVWTTANTLGDSIVSESGTALTVTGSLDTTLGASVTGDFAVNTNKFTVNATSGNVTLAGDISASTGDLALLSSSGEYILYGATNGQTNLYHNGVKKFETSSGGIYVTGDAVASSTVLVGTNNSIFAENNLRFKSTGAAFIDHNTVSQSIKFRLSNSSALDSIPFELTPSYSVFTGNVTVNSGNISVSGTGTFAESVIIHNSSNAPYIDFVESGAITDSKARITMDQVDTNNGTLLFATENAGTLFNQVKITQTGNLLLSDDSANFNTSVAKLNVLPASNGVYQQWNYSPSNENFSLKLKESVTSGNVRYVFDQINNGTTYSNALVFNEGKIGIGLDPVYKLDVRGDRIRLNLNSDDFVTAEIQNTTGSFYFGIDTTTGSAFGGANSARTIFSLGDYPMAFYTNSTERMRLKTPGSTIQDVTLQLKTTGASDNAGIMFINSGNTSSFNDIAGIASFVDSGSAKGNLQFWTRNSDGDNSDVATRMTIDSSGSVGIGTDSPRAVGSGYTGLEVSSASSGSSVWLSGFSDSTKGYLAMDTGGFNLTAISNHPLIFGTNNAPRMTITSGGDITIGNFTPGNPSRLNVRGSGTYNTTFSRPGATVQIISDELTNDTWSPVLNIANIRQSLTTGKDSFGGIGFSSIDDSNNAGVFDAARIALVNEQPSSVTSPTALAFYTNIATTQSYAASERMRITSDGLITLPTTGINDTRHIVFTGTQGDTNPDNAGSLGMWGNEVRLAANWYYNGAHRKTVAGNGSGVIGIGAGDTDEECYLTFGVSNPSASGGPIARMRITSGGVIEVRNGSTVGGEIKLTGADNDFTLNGQRGQTVFQIAGTTKMTLDSNQLYPEVDNTMKLGLANQRWSIVYAVSGVNTSDETLKENIQECDLGIDFINSLKPKSYNFKDLKEDNDAYGKKRYGLIAQDLLETELKDSVFGKKDGEYGLSYNDLIAPMIKAIQELKAEVDLLKKECKCK